MMQQVFDPVEFAKECIREKVNSQLPTEILYATIDMKKLIEICGYSESYLRQHFICTDEALELECGTTAKYLWKYPEIRDCWRDYCVRNRIRGKENQEGHEEKTNVWR